MYTTFTDGPAAGVRLSLQRSPILLRVVQNLCGEWDALDQMADAPAPQENLYLYVLAAEPGVCFIDGSRNGRRFGERRAMAEYRYSAEQPNDATMRDNESWRAWCKANYQRLLPEWARDKMVVP